VRAGAALAAALALLMILVLPGFAQVPQPPLPFYGKVFLGAYGQNPAPDGLEVAIYVGSETSPRGTPVKTANGWYGGPLGTDPKYNVPITEADFGKSLTFKVNGVTAQTFDASGSPQVVTVDVNRASFQVDLVVPAPEVESTDPTNGATGVPADKTITVTFKGAVQQGDKFADIAVKDASGKAVEVDKSISDRVLTIKPKAPLAGSTAYTVTIPAGAVKDAVAGIPLAKDFTFSFTTEQDKTPPAVQNCDPAAGATNVPVNKTITVTFTEDVQEGPQFANISLVDEQNNTITLQKSISGRVLTLKPASDLAYYKRYTVTIPAGAVKDAAGNELAQQCVFSFTTAAQQGAKIDITVPESGVLEGFTVPPGVSSAVLNQGGAQLEIPQGAFSGAATITFKPVDKAGLPGAGAIGQVFEIKIENVTLAQPVTLRLPAPAGERVRVFKLVGERWVNLGGTASGGYVEVSLTSFSTFTAANAPAPPTASPAAGSYTGSVQVTLSAEPGASILYGLNAVPETEYTAPITLTSSTTIRAVAVKDSLTSDEVSFAYTVTSAVTTPSGGGGGGVVRPYVSTTDPADKATGVTVDKEIKVVFSENVTAGSDFAKITLKDASGRTVDVTARIDGNVLYIKPEAALDYATTYTVVIPAGAVKDSSGYGLSGDYTFTFTTAGQPRPPVQFKDLSGHWAEDVVLKLAARGIISGYPDGTFRPDNNVTRAEFAKMLVVALDLAPDAAAAAGFADAAEIPAWARGYVGAAVKAGLIKGYEDKTFRADRQITRAELAVMVARALKAAEKAELGFKDAADIPSWAAEGIAQAVAKGIIKGYEDNTFRPANPATRAETAAMTLRLLNALGI
jgi:methionine-rich copper-binding protein CopC